MDVEQLSRELAEAIEQQDALGRVLEAIGRPSSELTSVFDTVLQHAVRLCKADSGMIWQRDGEVYRLAGALGGPEPYRQMLASQTIAVSSGTTAADEIGMVGLVGLERRTVIIDDARSDPRYGWPQAAELGGLRSMLGIPMLAQDHILGVIVLNRHSVQPFDGCTVALATTFATQGAIAIQHVRLVRELEERGADLARSVDELRVLGEISQAVGSSLDVVEVLTTIVHRAVELSRAEGGSIFEYDAESECFHVRAVYGTDLELIERIRRHHIGIADTFVGRTARSGEPQQSSDLNLEPGDPHINELRDAGWRALLVVPLLRENEIIGALAVRRHQPGRFSAQTADLLETLANQSAVAIHNARVYRQLEEKTQQLEVASEHKSEFLAGMSHELRTPLNAVIGFSDVLLERMFGDINPRQEEYLNDIRNAGRHLLELINEILDLSKVEAGRMELDLGPVSIPRLVDQTVAMVRERATQHRIAIHVDLADELGDVWADELKLTQVTLNLISNAVKFTGDGGSVTISGEVIGADAQVTVTDTGQGIPAEDHHRIFEAFQRGGRTARQSTEGTGLGLTLSKRIVNLHGGRMWMSSRVGVGSTFGFSVPIGQRPQPPAPPRDASDQSRTTILIVEDDPQSADLLSLYLEGIDVDLLLARDGVEGLEIARQQHPDAVILDIRLPRLDGWDLLALLKADPATATVPVVIVSMLDERGKGVALGAAEYLLKPVSRTQVRDALARVLPSAVKGTVVVIDGDPAELRLIDAILSPEGYTVMGVSDDEAGIQVVRREQPAVVLIDLMEPDIDGFAVVSRLRADPETAHVPIIFLGPSDIHPDDRRRFAGQINHLAEEGELGREELLPPSTDCDGCRRRRRDAHPHRRGQPAQPEARARHPRAPRLRHHPRHRCRRGHRPGARAKPRPDAHGHPAARHGRHPGPRRAPRGSRHPRPEGGGLHRVCHGARPREPARSRLRRVPEEAARREALPGPDRGVPPVSHPTVLVVDDRHENVRLLQAILEPRGYSVETATSGAEALRLAVSHPIDIVLLDVIMPVMDGYEVCRRLRLNGATRFLPVVMITASDDAEKLAAIDAGADDFIAKPFDQAELLSRVRSLIRIKHFHDTILRQTAELEDWNHRLEHRVSDQVAELERLARLKRFLPPQLVELVVETGDESFLESHRREITVVFCDLRGFTAFAEASEPEDVMAVLSEFHEALGRLVYEFEGTLDGYSGDGMMVFFNDPIPCDDGPQRAIRMAVCMREAVELLAEGWHRLGHDLHFGVGIAQGHATLGRIGFEGRFDYTAIGSVTNLAARLCAEARPGQILVSQRVYAAIEELAEAEHIGDLHLKGFSRPMAAYSLS